jgi:hypothetical protein
MESSHALQAQASLFIIHLERAQAHRESGLR